MDLVKQYIIQAIVLAANNLRLNSEKIESVAILREHLNHAENIGQEINRLKKITELSKIAIKLGELYNNIASKRVDFLKVSENFKIQSHSLVVVLSNFLDVVTASKLREILSKPSGSAEERVEPATKSESSENEIIKIIPPKRVVKNEETDKRDEMKEEIIFDDLEDEEKKKEAFDAEEFQSRILKPVRKLEVLLSQLISNDYDEIELKSYVDLMKKNADLADKTGFKVIANMHIIFGVGLKLISNKKLLPDRNIIESLRACLIVIVAVIRGKEVDITNYLNKAEQFGEYILKYK